MNSKSQMDVESRRLNPETQGSFFSSRRKFIQGLVALGIAGLGVDSLVEANHPVVVHLEVHLKRLPAAFDGLRIAQLSDFHYDENFSATAIRAAVKVVNQLNPDLVTLTGDFVTSPFAASRLHRSRKRAARAASPCAELLSDLRAKNGVMAVLGNHDWNTDPGQIAEILTAHQIKVLRNSSIPLEREGKRLWLSGADSYPDNGSLALCLSGIPQNEPVVLLVHQPDVADMVSKLPVDLQLSGHSHGGQVRIPIIGAPYLPPMGRKYPWGLRRVGALTLYTNIGIGTLGLPIRLNCPPEVTMLTLRPAV